MNIKTDLTQLIGETPLLELQRIEKWNGLTAKLLAKLENCNPLGSVKERAVLAMIEEEERGGFLKEGGVVIEPTGGNEGIALAFVCAVKGYRLIITMPESIPEERRQLLKILGAEVRLTPSAQGMKGAIAEANRLCEEIRHSYMPMLFQNPANPRIHREQTAAEIWRDTDGAVDIFVAGFGSGGTISGVGEGLKAMNPDIRVVGVEPTTSAVASGGKPGTHKIQGLGPGYIPLNLNLAVLDEILPISSEDAFHYANQLASQEALLVGASSGAVLCAGLQLARRPENSGKNIVLLFADSGERYITQGLYTIPD